MLTLLPYENFGHSAQVLDTARLIRQAAENYQIMQTLTGVAPSKDQHGEVIGFRAHTHTVWRSDKAVRMWRGHEFALGAYQMEVCTELRRRPLNDGEYRTVTVDDLTSQVLAYAYTPEELVKRISLPSWLGDERVHSSHRAFLLASDQSFYERWGWSENPSTKMFWPDFR